MLTAMATGATNGASATYVQSPVTRKRWRARSYVSLVLFIVATLLTPIAVVGHWGHQTIANPEQYISTVAPLAEDPEIQQAVADVVSNAIIEQVDTGNLASGLLGAFIPNERLSDLLSGPIKVGIDGLIRGGVDRFVTSSAFQEAWVKINEAAQRGFIAALSGDPSGPVQFEGDDLVLNISSLLQEVQTALVDEGIEIAGAITIPESDAQVVLLDSPALAQARAIYGFASPILSVILLLTAALFTLSVLLATRRARTTVAVGITVVAWAVVLNYSLSIAENSFVNAFQDTLFEQAATAFYNQLLIYLLLAIQGLLLLGVVIIVLGWFCGSTRAAVSVRGAIDSGLVEVGQRLPASFATIGRPLREYAPFVRWGLLGIWLIAVFAFGAVTLERTLGWTALLVGILTLAQILMHAPDDAAPDHRPSEARNLTSQ
jgi:hypothetical protein